MAPNDQPDASDGQPPGWLAPIPSHRITRTADGVEVVIFEYVYVTIAKEIVRAIQKGELVAGRQLPKQRDMAKSFGASLPTVARAVEALKQKGILEYERGKGVFVTEGGVKLVTSDAPISFGSGP